MPSLYEPFGYVVLEAGKLGTPVISSCRGGIYEVVGCEYRYVFDPYDRGRLTECIKRFQKDFVDVVEREVSRLTERVKMFSAEKMANEYRKLFNELLN
ncbi:glycosyltransferase [Caldicellulosiruptor acetigenus]|uniref:glycosyltransferase n=1 Tax=Caldicellulosiruptor acetigenus TaxID=301953 RepID=UPI000492E49C|nr:glycosyltransferase [Caldicellulosiruptor acetigenus]WAM35922.1 glycosyltransferase [Caldicellulosiruptor acetigenus]